VSLTAWVFLLLMTKVPPERHDGSPWEEPRYEAWRRYAHIASAIDTTCSDAPRLPRGCNTTKCCAALLSAIAIGESNLARDADEGPCYRVGPRYERRCDRGRAASVFQCQRISPLVSVSDLFASREVAAKQALMVASASLAKCGKLDPRDKLSGLSGRCIDGPGPWRARYALWLTLRAWEPPAKKEPAP